MGLGTTTSLLEQQGSLGQGDEQEYRHDSIFDTNILLLLSALIFVVSLWM